MPFPPITRLVRRRAAADVPSSSARLPFDQIDVLIVGELGQEYSESGLDPDVIGRRYVETKPEPNRPSITRLAVLDLSQVSHGNACGIGFADLTNQRLVSQIDPALTRSKALATGLLERVRIPISLATDRDVFRAALDTCWRVDPSTARLVLISNTRDLRLLWISIPLVEESRRLPDWEVDGQTFMIPFDDKGRCDLPSLFPGYPAH